MDKLSLKIPRPVKSILGNHMKLSERLSGNLTPLTPPDRLPQPLLGSKWVPTASHTPFSRSRFVPIAVHMVTLKLKLCRLSCTRPFGGKIGGVNRELDIHWPVSFQWRLTLTTHPGAEVGRFSDPSAPSWGQMVRFCGPSGHCPHNVLPIRPRGPGTMLICDSTPPQIGFRSFEYPLIIL